MLVGNNTSNISPRLFTSLINSLVTKEDKSFYGIIYTIRLSDDGTLKVEFKNPEDLSYNPEVLFGMMEEKIDSFFKYLSIQFDTQIFKEVKSRFEYFMDGDDITPNSGKTRYVYLNKSDEAEMNRISKSITIFTWSDGNDSLYSPVECKFKGLRCESEDNVVIDMDVKFLHPEYNSNLLSSDEFAKTLDELFSDDTFYDYSSQEFPNLLMEFVWTNQLILDKAYMFVTSQIDYFDKKGQVKWWENG